MNADLERQLEEMGPEYRKVVNRLIEAYEPVSAIRPPRRRRWIIGSGLLAAGLAVSAGVFMRPDADRVPPAVKMKNVCATEYELAHRGDDGSIAEIVRRQRVDGSWATDFLTRQNAAVLKRTPSARTAYKKALRYLRSKGLSPMSEEELSRLGATGEYGLHG
jgi:hypothetical protein